MQAFAQDVRYAVRMLRRSRSFAVVAVMALGLGIGATTAMFSVADGVLLRPLPYRDADRVVQIWSQNLQRGIPFSRTSYPDVAVWQRESRTLAAVTAYRDTAASLAAGTEPEPVTVAQVSASFFAVFGVDLEEGRAFLPDEDRPGGAAVAILSHDLATRRFAGSAATGRTVKVDGVEYAVVGVLPDTFRPAAGTVDVYLPLADDGGREGEREVLSVSVYARLAPGATQAQAQAELDGLSKRLDEAFPVAFPRSVRVWGLHEFATRNVRLSVLVLLGAVTMVLLIACVNVANLLLARSSGRRKEIAVRVALGATRRRLVAQLLTESLLVAAAGCVVGVLLAWWGVGLLPRLAPGLADQVALDGRALAFALAVTVATTVLFGLSPALAQSRPDGLSALDVVLKEEGRRGSGSARSRLRRGLVVGEVALSLVLLVGAGLLLKSFARLQEVNPGFNPDQVMTATLSLSTERYRESAHFARFAREFLDRLAATPGVTASGLTTSLPLSGHNQGLYLGSEEGPTVESPQIVWFRRVTVGYFRALEIPLLRGQLFDSDEPVEPLVVVVNRALAERFWPGEDPIGKHIRPPVRDPQNPPPSMTVIGVVGDIHHMALDAPAEPEMFMQFMVTPARAMTVAVRSPLGPETIGPAIARAAALADEEQAVSSVRTMTQAVYAATTSERLSTTLLTTFAALAVALALIGLYGVLSYAVDQRAHEIGVRMALGARRADVLRMVLREGVLTSLAGIAIGVAGALVATRYMASMLYAVSATDVGTFVAVSALLVLAALAASLVPARRATGIDPIVTLRS